MTFFVPDAHYRYSVAVDTNDHVGDLLFQKYGILPDSN